MCLNEVFQQLLQGLQLSSIQSGFEKLYQILLIVKAFSRLDIVAFSSISFIDSHS